MKKWLRYFLLLVWLVPASSWAATVDVSFQPSDSIVALGDTFSVDIFADFSDPVLGWGLDISFDSSILLLNGTPTLGALWEPASTMDGDGLAGLAFPTPISGSNVLLATLSFDAIAFGTSDLLASVSKGDLTEGFPLVDGGFADFIVIPGSVTVVPVPAAVWLFGSGLIGLVGLAKRKKA